MSGCSHRSVGRFALLVLLLGTVAGCGAAWANGNVSADEAPPPIRKSVKRAPIKKAAPKARKAKKKTPPAPARKKAIPSRPRISSLRQGIALMRQERYEAAYPWLQKAVQEERRNPEAWYWYGMYHERTAQFEQAQFFYRKAMELDPGFEPFSRVVVYPGDGERVPLWDPRRPARVYPIPTNDHGIAIIPPDSPQARRRPVRPPIDPELPKVPLYTPPEPGAGPFDGDAWQPSVYVPPGRESTLEGGEPAYAPPESRIVPLAPPPALEVGVALPAGGTPAPIPQPAPSAEVPPVPVGVQPGRAPVYQPPRPPARAGGAAPGEVSAPPAAIGTPPVGGVVVSGDAPAYRPPVPGAVSAGPASGDRPVYLPPLPADKK